MGGWYSTPYYSSESPEEINNRTLNPRRASVPVEPTNNGDPTEASRFTVINVNLDVLNNRKAHHTDEYRDKDDLLIVRRGQPFQMTVETSRDFNPDMDSLVLRITVGSKYTTVFRESKGTLVRIPVAQNDNNESTDKDDWHAVITKHAGSKIDIQVSPSANAIIGHYEVAMIDTKSEGNGEDFRYTSKFEDKAFILLFNPWCKDDDVYIEDESWREEYVMNENGTIYNGYNGNKFSYRPWNFDQFDGACLDAALHLMDKGRLSTRKRNSPIDVTRCLSAMINSANDGVLEGKWGKPYTYTDRDGNERGTAPWHWKGSVPIIKEYMKTKESVRYGQCWVFSAVSTTLNRALGIPTRSITNFSSAHDNDESLTIDYVIHENGNIEKKDSVWNFHVWNESWFKRSDLPADDPTNDGWQAHDATPQETSDGIYRCGPCPVSAIKEGKTYIQHDAGFIFAEVNADQVYWREAGYTKEVVSIKSKTVGKKISTKAVGKKQREDITHLYKYPEGSKEEREAVKHAFKESRLYDKGIKLYTEPEVIFSIDEVEDVMIGQDFEFVIRLKNTTDKKRTVEEGKVRVNLSFYTGTDRLEDLSAKKFDKELNPKEEWTFTQPVRYSDYKDIHITDSRMTVTLSGKVRETQQVHGQIESVKIFLPDLDVTLESSRPTLKVGEPFNLKLTLTNPLPQPLTGVEFRIESPVIADNVYVNLKDPVGAGETLTHSVSLTPFRKFSKEKTIIVEFNCDQIGGIDGDVDVHISE